MTVPVDDPVCTAVAVDVVASVTDDEIDSDVTLVFVLSSLPPSLLPSLPNVLAQEFAVRQDSACGSTIGPIIATSLGVRTVDVGIAQLSMHSIREMCGASDVAAGVALFSTFFSNFEAIDGSLTGSD